MIHTHQTAPTQFVEANGIRFAYRQFGIMPDAIWRLTIRCQRSRPRCHSLHSRHRGAAADPGPLIGRASLIFGRSILQFWRGTA